MKRGPWIPIPIQGFIHECCNCGVRHEIDVSINHRGILEFRWTPIKPERNPMDSIAKWMAEAPKTYNENDEQIQSA